MAYQKISERPAATAITDDDLLVIVDSPGSSEVTKKITWSAVIGYFATGSNGLTFSNTGLHILDTDASHDLIIKPGSNLSADRTLTITTGDANRTVTLNENLTVGDGYDVTLTAEDAAGSVTLDNCSLEVEDTVGSGNTIKFVIGTDSASRTVTLSENLTIGDGYSGTIAFSAASKTLTVEGTSVVNQDLTTDAIPGFYGLGISYGDVTINPVSPPGAPTAALVEVAGNVDAGEHQYRITFVTALGETQMGTASAFVTADGTHQQVQLTGIPTGTAGIVTARKIYRSLAGETTGRVAVYLLATINDNTTTTYTDNTADSGLDTDNALERENTTAGAIKIGATHAGRIGMNSDVSLGYGALESETCGGGNVAVGWHAMNASETGRFNIGIGYQALLSLTTGSYNVAIGDSPLANITTSSWNVAIGWEALVDQTSGNKSTAIGYGAGHSVTTGSSNVFVGFCAGYYETGSSKLFIDNQTRSSEADARTKALIYGVFAASTADQYLYLNAFYVDMPGRLRVGTATDASTAGDFSAGLTGASRMFYDQNVARLYVYSGNGTANGYMTVDTNGYLQFTGSGNRIYFYDSAGVKHWDVLLNYAGSGEVPAGVMFYGSTDDMAFVGSANAGEKIMAAYYNGTSYYSAWEVANVASGRGDLLLLKSGGNVGVGQSTFGTSASRVIGIGTGTAPASAPADAAQLYSADQAAGNACIHAMTENGAIIKLYKETTGVTEAAFVENAGGTAVNVDSTFGGYTLQQIVQALQNQGLLT